MAEASAPEEPSSGARLARWPLGIVQNLVRAVPMAIDGYFRDRLAQHAAGIAYRVLFSLVPLTIVLVSIVGIVLHDEARRQDVIERDREPPPLHRGGDELGRGGDHPPREPDERVRPRIARSLLLGVVRDDGRGADRARGGAPRRAGPPPARRAREARRPDPRRGRRRPPARHDRGHRRRPGGDAARRGRGGSGRARGRPAHRARPGRRSRSSWRRSS